MNRRYLTAFSFAALWLFAAGVLAVPAAEAADGSGTSVVAPVSVNAGSTGDTLTFTFTAAETMDSGTVSMTVPSGWSAPQGVNGAPGYVTASSSGGIIATIEDALESASNWTAQAGDCNSGLSADAVTFHEGAASLSCKNSASTNNTSFYRNLASPEDWSGYTNVAFWIRTSASLNANQLKLLYSASANVAAPIASLAVPAINANTWTYVNLPLSGVRTSVASFGFQTAGATAQTNNINIDDILVGPGLPTFLGGVVSTRFLQLAAGQTRTLTYGAGGGASGASAPASGETSVFTVQTRVSDGGTVTAIGSSPLVTVFNPAPTTTGITPASKSAGASTFTLTVNGTNFVPASVVQFNGSSRTTTYISPTQLTATIPAGDIVSAGTFNITVFNPTPGGGTSGAQVLTVTADTTAPAAVSNLALSSPTTSSMVLTWTAPGDDGSVGTATLYDIRYSTSPIVSGADFSAASLVSGEPAPAVAGTVQNMTVTGLSANTTYYFAMKTQDEVPNVSALSNVPSLSTSANPDVTPPATVTTLAASSPTTSSIALSWTAPGDDGSVGTAALYDIRYSTSPIVTDADFSAASQVSGEPAPAVAGTVQNKVVTGLSANTTYYFAMKTQDEVPNISALSNVPSLSTSSNPDVTPPAAVSNLALSSPTTSSMVLSWTAPGDDGSSGTATLYDIRYSTSPIVSGADFSAASLVSGEPAPAVAGAIQSMSVAGLTSATTYYFAMKTQDEVPNVSALSNLPSLSTTTNPDVTPPATVTTLAASSPTTSSIALSWTAPGDDGSVGTATLYDIRYSTSPIVSGADFSAASLVSGEPAPAVAGTVQNMTVTGLSANTTYYFAMKTQDEVPNISALSNVPSLSTAANPDTVAPSAISDLSLSAPSTSSMVLTWTAPGDDGSSGTAALYDIRYSTSPIVTDADFSAASQVSDEPAPAIAGTVQSTSIAGLASATIYSFAMKTQDEAPNVSTLSNAASLSTKGGGGGGGTEDTSAPSAVTDLALSGATASSMTLSWTAPGDDGNNGTAFSYDIRYSTSPIVTGADFTLATQVSGEPAPAVAGTAQGMTVNDLSANTSYYFAIKTQDEVPNVSPVSNVPTLRTAAPSSGGGGGGVSDTAPPSGFLIAAASITSDSALITWDTNENADSLALFGPTDTLGGATFDGALVVHHVAPMIGLTPSTTYHYKVCSRDSSGNQACFGPFTFTTLSPRLPSTGFPTSPAYGVADALVASPTINIDKSLVASSAGTASPCVSGALLKLPDDGDPATQSDSAVYYCGADGKRYVFPDAGTYRSWYPNFSSIAVTQPAALAAVPLGGDVTYRPGSRMVKVQTDPKVYAVAGGGVLRWVTTEAVAESLYGLNWKYLVDDLSDAFFVNYAVGEPILATDVTPAVPASGTTSACTTSATFTEFLSVDSNDPQVFPLQALLACLGYFPADVPQTGHFGPATVSALKAFQSANGIEPLGYVGPATRAALNRYASK